MKPDRQQINDMTVALGSPQKHEDAGVQPSIERTPTSQKIYKRIANTVLPRRILPHSVSSHCERGCPLRPLRQHPLASLSQPDQGIQPQDQSSKFHRGEMRAHPAPTRAANHERWSPWSPEDVCAHDGELNHNSRCSIRRYSEGETLLKLRREPPAVSPPAYYHDPEPVPSPSCHDFQNTFGSGSAIAMPLRQTQRRMSMLSNDSCEKPAPPERNPKRLTMSRTSPSITCCKVDGMTDMKHYDDLGETPGTEHNGSVRKSAINIIRLRPHPSRPERSSSLALMHARPSPLGSHPTAINDTGEFPMPPVPPRSARRLSPAASSKSNGQDRPFDVEPIDQHKTNVRRPPKGIQHWFDAYISSDDEDDGDEGRKIDAEKPEPQELPADEVPRPAYTIPARGSSLGAEHATSSVTGLPAGPDPGCINTLRSPVGSGSSNSIQSSHCRGGRRTLGVSRRLASTDLAQESVLSMSSSDYTSSDDDYDYDDDDDDVAGLPTIRDSIRDSIFDDRNFEVTSAASVRVQRLSPPGALNGARGPQIQFGRSVENLQNLHSYVSNPSTQVQYAPPSHESSEDSGGVDVTLRRLNGYSTAKHSAKSTSLATSDAGHIIAVTDEEMAVLEMMRKKRAEMQQASFMESLPQKRHDRTRHEPTNFDRPRRTSKATSFEPQTSAAEIERQLDGIRKAQVDAGFQIERFLGMTSPSQPSCETQANAGPSEALLLPATVYNPADATARRAPPREDRRRSEEDVIDVQRRVEQFIATQGAVPPLNSIRTMRRPSHQAISPARAVEQAMPPVAPLRKIRTSSSGTAPPGLQHQVSVIHKSQSGMHRTSPVSALPSGPSSPHDFMPAPPLPSLGTHLGFPEYSAHAERPRTATGLVDRRVKFQRSLPRINTDEALEVQRSSIGDVLEGWRDLGGSGGGFIRSAGLTSQRV